MYTSTCLKRKSIILCMDHRVPVKEKHEIRIKVVKGLKEVSLYLKENTFIMIDSTLGPEKEKALVQLLNTQKQKFTFQPIRDA